MARNKKIRTLYNPAVGCQYQIKNLKTDTIHVASTLTVRDADQKPWRSPKGTPQGEEFFKMKIGKKQTGFTYIKFINSSLKTDCISDDGEWEFLAITPDGKQLPKLTDGLPARSNSSKIVKPKKVIKQKVQKQEKKEDKSVVITEDIFKSEFVDEKLLADILGD